MPHPYTSDRAARYATLGIAAFSLIFNLILVLAWRHYSQMDTRLAEFSAVVSAFTLIVCLLRKKLSPQKRTLMILVNVCLTLGTSWSMDQQVALTDLHFEPFLGFKLVALIVAIAAPLYPWPWIGFLIVGSCAVFPVVLFYSMPLDIQIYIFSPEPWPSLTYAMISSVILINRVRTHNLQARMALELAQKASTERLARVFLGLRDLSNSPVQSLILLATLLRERCPEAGDLLNGLDNSIERLVKLSVTLSKFESETNWLPSDVSFDPVEMIHAENCNHSFDHSTALSNRS